MVNSKESIFLKQINLTKTQKQFISNVYKLGRKVTQHVLSILIYIRQLDVKKKKKSLPYCIYNLCKMQFRLL